ncbi:type IV secretory system conjugative DNA transfer family protein (plasmid) [Neptuniibacter sp. QD72_48]|uniref:type IV secretory system conjugative DNA transfer family protein n=1 Tax=Neptuniibacter sp. QD72_48 TaxID=3398214 RepID=UPI0039F4E1C2
MMRSFFKGLFDLLLLVPILISWGVSFALGIVYQLLAMCVPRFIANKFDALLDALITRFQLNPDGETLHKWLRKLTLVKDKTASLRKEYEFLQQEIAQIEEKRSAVLEDDDNLMSAKERAEWRKETVQLKRMNGRLSSLKWRLQQNLLLNNDVEGYARLRHSEKYWDFMFEKVPNVLRQQIHYYGRLITGDYLAVLSQNEVDGMNMSEAFPQGIKAAVKWMIVFLLGYTVFATYFTASMPDVYQVVKKEAQVVQRYDYFFEGDAERDAQSQWLSITFSEQMGVALTAIFNPAIFFGLLAIGLLVPLNYIYNAAYRAVNNRATDIQNQPIKMSDVGWPEGKPKHINYLMSINTAIDTYKNYLKPNGLDYFYTRGVATGLHERQNGATSVAPMAGQRIGMMLEKMFTPTLIIGRSGANKTRGFISFLMGQIMSLRHGALIQDYKGELMNDLIPLIDHVKEQTGVDRSDDIIIIGDKEEHCGVNLIDGLTTAEVADMLVVLSRKGMTPNDPFFETQAKELFRAVVEIALASASIEAIHNKAWDKLKMNPWSIAHFFKLLQDEEYRDEVLEQIHEELDNNTETGQFIDCRALAASLSFFTHDFYKMAEKTRTSIDASAKNFVNAYSKMDNITYRRFISNQPLKKDKMVDVSDAFDGKILGIALKGYGDTVKGMIQLMIKTRFMMLSMKRQTAYSEMKLNVQRNAIPTAYICDEFQNLCVFSKEMVSDANFWNVNRSTGVYPTFVFQSISSLTQHNQKEAENFIGNASNVFILSTDDQETTQFAKRIAGKVMRSNINTSRYVENIPQLLELNGQDYLKPQGTFPHNDENLTAFSLLCFPSLPSMNNQSKFYEGNFYSKLETSFDVMSAGNNHREQHNKEELARERDIEEKVLGSGWDYRDFLDDHGVGGEFGQNQAFAKVGLAGGGIAVDIIELSSMTEFNR